MIQQFEIEAPEFDFTSPYGRGSAISVVAAPRPTLKWIKL
jgi:hypothetical protein